MAESIYYDKKTSNHIKVKRVIALALAAALILALGVGAYATYNTVSGPAAAEKVALEQIEEWKKLGLLSREVTFEGPATQIVEIKENQGNDYWYGRFFPHSYDVRWYSEAKYNCNLRIDTLSGKIVYAVIGARPDETDEPIETTVSDQPIDPYDLDKGSEQITLYYYDNYDDIFSPDLTVDQFCNLLAEYWGFSGYRIADTVDEVWYHEHWEAVDGSTLLKDLPRVNPTNFYLTVFFEGDQKGAPMYISLENFPGNNTLSLGNRHAIG